jgi:hypothetical protein
MVTVTEAGKPINCRAEGLDIGSGTYIAKDRDSIELLPVPDCCSEAVCT